MDLYGLTLLTHSWLRWGVVVLGIAVLVVRLRSALSNGPVTLGRLDRGFIVAIDAQFILGLLLYGIWSPYTRAAFSDLSAAMGDSVLRFFTIEHVFGMLIAIGAAHLGYDRLKAASGPEASKPPGRVPLIAQVAWLVATLASIPWPFLPYGRPLARLFL